MTDITQGERYTSLFPFSTGLDFSQMFLCFDQAKANLFWLVEPRVDTEGIEAARMNPIAIAINSFMDKETRRALKKLPNDFMDYWDKVDDGATELAQDWPADYRQTMTRRAAEAQRRLTVLSESENVVKVNFRRKA